MLADSHTVTHLSALQTSHGHCPSGISPAGPTGDAWYGTQQDCGSEQTDCGTTGTVCANPLLHRIYKRKEIVLLSSLKIHMLVAKKEIVLLSSLIHMLVASY